MAFLRSHHTFLTGRGCVAVAVRVTAVPLARDALQVDPQFTPAGDEVTVPVPVPALATART